MTSLSDRHSGAAQARSTGILVIGNTAATLADIVTPLLLVRLLSRDELGILGGLLIIFQTATMIGAGGLPRALLYFLPERPPQEQHTLAWRLMGLSAGLAALATCAILIWAGFQATMAEEGVDRPLALLPWVALYVGLDIPTRMLPNMLVAADRARSAAATSLLRSLGITAATLLPAALGAGNEAILIALCLWSGCYFAATLAWFQRIHPMGHRCPSPTTLNAMLRFAIPLGITDMVNILNKGIDRFLVMAVFATAVWADYQVGAWQIPVLSTIAYAAGSVQMPVFRSFYERGEKELVVATWRASIAKVSLVVVPLTVAFMVAAPAFIRIFFTDEYTGAVPIFRWYTVLTLGRVAVYAAPMLAAGRSDFVLYASALTLVSNIVVSVPLVALVGPTGAAMGTALAFIPSVAAYTWFIAKATSVRWRAVFPITRWLLVVAHAGASAAAVAGGLSLLHLPDPAELAVTLVGVCGVFALLGTATGLISRDDWRFALDWVSLRIMR